MLNYLLKTANQEHTLERVFHISALPYGYCQGRVEYQVPKKPSHFLIKSESTVSWYLFSIMWF